MNSGKTIHDAIYGSIDLDEHISAIITAREFQRLASIKQLGFSYLAFPGATHSRFEHSLGTHYLSREAGKLIGLSEKEVRLASIAGLLHDIGHSPFSHSLEQAMNELYRKDHLQVGIDLIEGRSPANEISDLVGEEKKDVVEILKGKKGILSRLISGNGDADQIDYLARDSYYTGVALGTVDFHRILRTLEKCGDQLCVQEKGLPSMEGLMIGRMLMHKSVYRHKTGIIAGSIANKALKILNPVYEEFLEWDDCDFMSELKANRETLNFYNTLKYRKLPMGLIIKEDRNRFTEITEKLEKDLIASQYLGSPFKKEVIRVQSEKGIRPITELSSIMEFLQGELEVIGLLVFDQSVRNRIRDELKKERVVFQ